MFDIEEAVQKTQGISFITSPILELRWNVWFVHISFIYFLILSVDQHSSSESSSVKCIQILIVSGCLWLVHFHHTLCYNGLYTSWFIPKNISDWLWYSGINVDLCLFHNFARFHGKRKCLCFRPAEDSRNEDWRMSFEPGNWIK